MQQEAEKMNLENETGFVRLEDEASPLLRPPDISLCSRVLELIVVALCDGEEADACGGLSHSCHGKDGIGVTGDLEDMEGSGVLVVAGDEAEGGEWSMLLEAPEERTS
jgi:hypothetical protein